MRRALVLAAHVTRGAVPLGGRCASTDASCGAPTVFDKILSGELPAAKVPLQTDSETRTVGGAYTAGEQDDAP